VRKYHPNEDAPEHPSKKDFFFFEILILVKKGLPVPCGSYIAAYILADDEKGNNICMSLWKPTSLSVSPIASSGCFRKRFQLITLL
jgi:hypothetical protein